jgi:hypothetical protein
MIIFLDKNQVVVEQVYPQSLWSPEMIRYWLFPNLVLLKLVRPWVLIPRRV